MVYYRHLPNYPNHIHRLHGNGLHRLPFGLVPAFQRYSDHSFDLFEHYLDYLSMKTVVMWLILGWLVVLMLLLLLNWDRSSFVWWHWTLVMLDCLHFVVLNCAIVMVRMMWWWCLFVLRRLFYPLKIHWKWLKLCESEIRFVFKSSISKKLCSQLWTGKILKIVKKTCTAIDLYSIILKNTLTIR